MANYEEIRRRSEDKKFQETGLFLKYEKSFDSPDHKGFDAMMGQHCEGSITYHSSASDLVMSGDLEPGWHWCRHGHDDDKDANSDGPLGSFEEAAKAFETYLFKNMLSEAKC